MGDPTPPWQAATPSPRPASRFRAARRSLSPARRPRLAGHESLVRTTPTPHLTYWVTF